MCHVRKGHRFIFSLLLATSHYALRAMGWVSGAERNRRELDESFVVHGLAPVPMFLDLPPFDFSSEASL